MIKKAISEAQEKDENKRNGIKYIESEYLKKKNVIKIWLTEKFYNFNINNFVNKIKNLPQK